MIVVDALQSILTILIMIVVGYVLTLKGWFDQNVSKLFANLIVKISLPALMLTNLMSRFDRKGLMELAKGLVVPFGALGISYILSILIGRLINVSPKQRGLFRAMFALSNTIFIGLPVNVALFGDNSVPFVLLFFIANTTLFWTIGVYGIRQDGQKVKEPVITLNTVKRIFSPPLLSFIFAILLILFKLELPKFIMDASRYIGNLTTPLSMLLIGIILHSIDVKDMKVDKTMALVFIGRFVITPALFLVFFRLLYIPELMQKVFLIESAMPAMTQTAIVAQAYNADHKYAAMAVAMTTIAGLIIIPFYMLITTLL